MAKLCTVNDKQGNMYGFLLKRGKNLCLINRVVDFYNEGFLMLCKVKRNEVSVGSSNQVWLRGMALNKVKSKSPRELKSALTLKTLFKAFARNKKIVMVDYKDRFGKNTFVGIVDEVGPTFFKGRFYQISGEFARMEKLSFSNIKSVQWDNLYLKTMTELSKLPYK